MIDIIFISKISNRISSSPCLVPLLCSNHHQILFIASLKYISILEKKLKQVVNETENDLSFKVFLAYIGNRQGNVCLRAKDELDVQIITLYKHLQTPAQLVHFKVCFL